VILVDANGWLEYLADRPLAGRFAAYLEGREPMIVSAIEVYEVYTALRRDLPEERAVEAVSALSRATIVSLDASLALEAADLAIAHGLTVADAVVYATARRHSARLVTSGTHFEGLPHAEVVR
jgi:predicted nucleic acid-binding protein